MKKILVCLLILNVGNTLFAANVASPKNRSAMKESDRFNDEDPRVLIVKEVKEKKHNFFSISIVGEFYDMINNMFESSTAIEAAWVYDFEKYVFLELGMSWNIVGPKFNDASVVFGIGFKPIKYYEPELFINSQFLGGYDFKVGLRNNIKIDGPVTSKLFFDLGISRMSETEEWTYFLALGVGLEI